MYVIKEKGSDNRYYVCDVENGWFHIAEGMSGAYQFDTVEEAKNAIETQKQLQLARGDQFRDDYIVIEYSDDIVWAEDYGDDSDYEREIMRALRNGDGDRFGL